MEPRSGPRRLRRGRPIARGAESPGGTGCPRSKGRRPKGSRKPAPRCPGLPPRRCITGRIPGLVPGRESARHEAGEPMKQRGQDRRSAGDSRGRQEPSDGGPGAVLLRPGEQPRKADHGGGPPAVSAAGRGTGASQADQRGGQVVPAVAMDRVVGGGLSEQRHPGERACQRRGEGQHGVMAAAQVGAFAGENGPGCRNVARLGWGGGPERPSPLIATPGWRTRAMQEAGHGATGDMTEVPPASRKQLTHLAFLWLGHQDYHNF